MDSEEIVFGLYNLPDAFVVTNGSNEQLTIYKKGCLIKTEERKKYIEGQSVTHYGVIGIVNVKGSLWLGVIKERR